MKKPVFKNACWVLLLCAAVFGIAYGCAESFGREEWEIVLNKAVNVCFQCIGLG